MKDKSIKGFTLLELIIVVIIIGILATFAIPNYYEAHQRVLDREAQGLLELIQRAEKLYRLETNSYINCTDTADCNTQLRLDLPQATWNYTVQDANTTFFCAQANRTSSAGWHMNITAINTTSGMCP